MKKLSLLLIAIFSLLAFNNAKAQFNCPQGWTQSSLFFTYTNENTVCTLKVDFCFQCAPTLTGFKVKILSLEATDPYCWNVLRQNFSYLLSLAEFRVIQHQSEICDIAPCNQSITTENVEITTSVCWRDYNNGSFIQRVPCEDGFYCKKICSVCLDYNYNPPRKRFTQVVAMPIGGTPSCPLRDISVNENLNPGEYGNCYKEVICQ